MQSKLIKIAAYERGRGLYCMVSTQVMCFNAINCIKLLHDNDVNIPKHAFVIVFFKWAKPGLFFVYFLFFSHDKYNTKTINEKT